MSDLLRIALALFGTAPPRRSATESIVAVTASVIAALAVTAALACGAAALWIGMRPLVGPIGAPLIVAAAFLALALVALASTRRALRPPATPTATPGSNAALLVEASHLVAAHKVPMLLAAVLAGVAAGSRDK